MRPVDAVAGTLYGARLRLRGRLPIRLLALPLVLIRNAVLGALGFLGDSVVPAQVEIFRLSDGALVDEIPAGGSYETRRTCWLRYGEGLRRKPHPSFSGCGLSTTHR